MVYVGIDIGGTGIQVGIVDEKGIILQKGSMPTGVGRPFADIVKDMCDCVEATLAKSGHTMLEVHSVGVGVPGFADAKNGHVYYANNLGWTDVPLREEMQKHLDKPVYIDNDATVAGLAESVAGVTAGTDSSVFVTLGTGVGGGIVLHGKVWSGHHGIGSEIGHMIMEMDGVPCTCGNRGCLERYCSATAIIRMAREQVAVHPESMIMTLCGGDPEKINAKMVFDASKEGDAIGQRIFHRYIDYLAQAMATIINFLDPEVIALGGGVSKAGSYLLDALRAEVGKYVLGKNLPFSRIEIAELGPEAGIIGAAMLGA